MFISASTRKCQMLPQDWAQRLLPQQSRALQQKWNYQPRSLAFQEWRLQVAPLVRNEIPDQRVTYRRRCKVKKRRKKCEHVPTVDKCLNGPIQDGGFYQVKCSRCHVFGWIPLVVQWDEPQDVTHKSKTKTRRKSEQTYKRRAVAAS